MRSRLPSMTSLRAFEAAARHLSFTRAAIELDMAPTAVGRQIKNLEAVLGITLFRRNNNALSLSDSAEEYLRAVRSTLHELSVATDRAAEQEDENVLTIECAEAFAVTRLMRSLQTYFARHATLSLRLRTDLSPEATSQHAFDVAIWHGTGNWGGVSSHHLGADEIFPVCTPGRLASGTRLRHPSDLRFHTAIRTSSSRDEWRLWLEAAGQGELEFSSQFSCQSFISSIQAALGNLGIAMGRSSVVEDDLSTGRLAEPFGLRIRSPFAYYLVVPNHSRDKPKVRRFVNWFLAQTASSGKPFA